LSILLASNEEQRCTCTNFIVLLAMR
jgi:hypothetical protein